MRLNPIIWAVLEGVCLARWRTGGLSGSGGKTRKQWIGPPPVGNPNRRQSYTPTASCSSNINNNDGSARYHTEPQCCYLLWADQLFWISVAFEATEILSSIQQAAIDNEYDSQDSRGQQLLIHLTLFLDSLKKTSNSRCVGWLD
jgi:hypothetical protein